jgi:hypothetical protein
VTDNFFDYLDEVMGSVTGAVTLAAATSVLELAALDLTAPKVWRTSVIAQRFRAACRSKDARVSYLGFQPNRLPSA